jgi:hypothetical protein
LAFIDSTYFSAEDIDYENLYEDETEGMGHFENLAVKLEAEIIFMFF